MDKDKGLLMVTVGFPPRGGGGVQRNAKFLKYLFRMGWRTSVLTLKEVGFFVTDYSLLEDVKDAKIYRSHSLDPVTVSHYIKKLFRKNKTTTNKKNPVSEGVNETAWYVSLYRKFRDFVLVPDGYGGWIPFAYRMGCKAVREQRPAVLFASFPGPSNALVTYKLAKKFHLPYVIDFRDAWLDDPYVKYPTKLHKAYHRHLEKKIITGASKVIVYGDVLRDILIEKYPKITERTHVITNGFDPEDFDGIVPKDKDPERVRIVYSGAVSYDRIETFRKFVDALEQLNSTVLDKLEVLFVGKKYGWATELIEQKGFGEIVRFTGYLEHKEALSYLASADAALLFLSKGDLVALTGKVFEYIGLRLPIIACVEREGVCAKMLYSINHDQGVCSPDSSREIAEKITLLVNEGLPRLEAENLTRFSRKHHSDLMNAILTDVITGDG